MGILDEDDEPFNVLSTGPESRCFVPTNSGFFMLDTLRTDVQFLPVSLTRNRIEHLIDAADPATPDRNGLRYLLTLATPSFPQAGDMVELLTMPGSEKPPERRGGVLVYEGATFRLNELLDGELTRPKPTFGQSGLSVLATLTTPYVLTECIKRGGTILTTKANPKQWAFKGGLSEPDFAGWGGRFLTDYQATNRRFLTNSQNGKVIGAGQEEYLSFLLNLSPMPQTINRRVKIRYASGTCEIKTVGSVSGLLPYQVVCAPVGPAALGLSEGVISYRVWLSDENNARLTEVRSYRIDTRHRKQARAILFANSLSGWDTLRLTGEGSETLKTIRGAAQLERPFGAGADFNELQVIYVQGSRELTVSTGWIEKDAKAMLRYLDELLLSEECYLQTPKGHQALELITSSLVDHDDKETLVARSFTFRFTTPELNFSDLPPAPTSGQRATAWRGVGSVILTGPDGKRTGKGRPLKLQRYYTDDNSPYKPLTEKPNVPGDADYIPEITLPGIAPGSTPYPSATISREGTYNRATCANGQTGRPAIITIPAGTFGGEAPGDADQLAAAAWASYNTQAHADIHGTCSTNPYDYPANVPANYWRFRTNLPAFLGLFNAPANLGNAWFWASGANLAPFEANDYNVPVTTSPANWQLGISTTRNEGSATIKVYKNGSLISTRQMPYNAGPYGLLGADLAGSNGPVSSGDKLFIEVTF